MSPLDFFALFILVVLFICGVSAWIWLAFLPGAIARARRHPKAEAVTVCGYWGAITFGILMPLAFIWAYAGGASPTDNDSGEMVS